VFLKALAVQPHDRYARAREFWGDLEAALGGMPLSTTAPGSQTARMTPVSRRSQPSDMGATELAPHVPTLAGSAATNANVTGPAQASGGKGGVVIGALVGVAALAAGAFFAFGRGANKPPSGADSPPAASATPVTAAALPAPSASAAPPAVCPSDMVQIPAGQFFMGSDAKDAEPSEKPSHNVSLTSFCLDLYEVTAKKYRDCSGVGKCRRAPTEVEWPNITPADRKLYSTLCTGNDPEKLDHPINCVTWDLADAYCKASDRRLPTEAEWEFATRGPDGRVYPWGDEPPTAAHLNACGSECVAWGKANHVELKALYDADDGFATTAPVGKFPAGRSRFGPYDVAGNVWEWVSDWYGAYATDAGPKDPSGPDKGEKKVIRGGAFNGSFASWLHPAFRYAQVPKAQSHGIGFRCAKSINP
jgi:formylglycine-generating enzyme required for sulfatase activity